MTNKTVVITVQNDILPFTKFVKNPENLAVKYQADNHLQHRRHSEKPTDPAVFSKAFEILNHKVHDKKKAKKVIRSADVACDHPLRANLWRQLADLLGCNLHRSDAYEETLKTVYGDEVETFQTNERSHQKPYPHFTDSRFSSANHHLTSEGIFSTHRILTVIAFERPDITYAPTLPSLTSTLLHYLPEEEVYHLLGTLLSRTSKERYVTQTRIAYQASSAVFNKLAKKYFKSACNHVRKAGHNTDVIFTDWVFWIFNHLPFNHLVRVIDCYLYEGPKILYRVALAILHHFHKNKHEKCIVEYCGRIDVCPKTLLKTSFNIRGLSRGHMFELMSKREMHLSTRDSTFAQHVTSSTSIGSLHVPTNTNSQLVTRSEWRHIYEWLPARMTLKRPLLIFSTAEHGTSLLTFYKLVEGHDPTFLVLKSTNGEMIGAYLAGDWQDRRGRSRSKFFGTGESFVCKFNPTPVKFAWVGIGGGDSVGVGSKEEEGKEASEGGERSISGHQTAPPPTDAPSSTATSMFATGDASSISIGGGNGQAIQLDSNLLEGSSTHCSTFNNPPLIANNYFRVATLEVFAFQ